eukprot:GHVS01085621.1.p1 GENE.GHVS01085621.1~~GHVS01085621.1.p1  ORF type:complete len:608 (+),score=102.64 GHVS01085621.1:364-2187(+)
MKFGGSSLKSSDRIVRVAEIIVAHLHAKPCVILSAFGSTTNDLLALGRAATLNRSPCNSSGGNGSGGNGSGGNGSGGNVSMHSLEQFHLDVITELFAAVPAVRAQIAPQGVFKCDSCTTDSIGSADATTTSHNISDKSLDSAPPSTATITTTTTLIGPSATTTASCVTIPSLPLHTPTTTGGGGRLPTPTSGNLQTTTAVVRQLLGEVKGLLEGVTLLKELSPRVTDRLVSYGERLAVRIFAGFLNAIGIRSKSFDAWDIGMLTSKCSACDETDKTDVRVLPEAYNNIHDALSPLNKDYCYTPVITGFIAKDKSDYITTLGRSGSDFSAAIIGAAVHARVIDIWTDVNGVLTCDPKHVRHAKTVPLLSFEEASELAYFGAKVLHPKTMHPAMKMGVPIRVRNAFNPTHEGTTVLWDKSYRMCDLVTAITSKAHATVVDVHSSYMLGASGFLNKLFAVFDQLRLPVDVIATSEVSVSLTLEKTVPSDRLQQLKERLEAIATTTLQEERCIISIVCNTSRTAEILGMACYTLANLDIPVEMVSCGASKVNINLVVDGRNRLKAVEALHETFFSLPYNDVGSDWLSASQPAQLRQHQKQLFKKFQASVFP